MNKINPKQTSNKLPWWAILLIAASIGVLISGVIYVLTPKTPSLPESSITETQNEESKTSFENISYTGPNISFPNEVKIYRIKETSLSEGNIKQRLLETYDLEPYESVNEVWVGPEYSLHKPEGKAQFTLSLRSDVSQPKRLKSMAAINTAKKEINKLFPNETLTPIKDQIEYLRGQYHLSPTNEDNAQWVKIPFSYLIDNKYPAYYQKETQPIAKVFIGPDYKVQKITIFAPLLKFEEQLTKDAISVTQAVEKINQNNQTIIIKALTSKHGDLDFDNIKSGELRQVQLEYRLDRKTGLLYPFYKFKGELINHSGEKIFAQIITNAVEKTSK
jgi:hypothetical protein